MKTTQQQFKVLENAVKMRADWPVFKVDTIVIENIVTDLRALQQYEAAGAAQFKAPLVISYIDAAIDQVSDLLDMVKQAGDHLKTGGPV